MTREDVECIVRTSMFTSHSQQFLDHDAEQRQQIEQQAAEIARLREALELTGRSQDNKEQA